MNLPTLLQPQFPNNKTKALIMSYDDGSEHDRRLVELFNRYGIRGTFHLNSGKLGQAHHIGPHEVSTLYQGHEVSCHSVTHPDLTQLDDDAIRHEIGQDRQTLEDLTGYSVRGLAYPFGTYNERILVLLPELGIEYARTATATHTFTIPDTYLRWQPSCHHSGALELGKQFLTGADSSLQVFTVWGHSYELDGFMTVDPSKDWGYMEAFCQLWYEQAGVYCTTAIDLFEYLGALQQLSYSPVDRTLTNASARSLWVAWQTVAMEIPPGQAISCNNPIEVRCSFILRLTPLHSV
ncbi:MAG: polysaccharide deacetylase family protein [Candidatus Competibacteraceae bacterium]|nr:polysaccharide deacetylase family protein [Candidatus Competibacteraceae bacterium]